jgi:outer membrane protein assembly factor BamE (lipoprotein component of BamABCDE complex)
MIEAARLEHGMSKEDVTRLLGLPDRTEGLRVDGKGVVVWFYRLADQTGHRVSTPLVFENNRLAGWGDTYYQMILKKAGSQSR